MPKIEHALFNNIKHSICEWRQCGYICEGYDLISSILDYQTEGHKDYPISKFLREPQLFALEAYWYVRLVLETPSIVDLYKHYYGGDKKVFFDALGVPISKDAVDFADIDSVIKKVKEDEGFVSEKNIQALHEAVKLDYPSYILALAMGAGKTVLIGAIIATEFAMSMRYPDSKGKVQFMKNALVFAPGKTIIESLRELSDMPYEKILPPGLYRDFFVNLKIEFPGKAKDIQAQKGSIYNLIVTNTEKISLRARPYSRHSKLIFERNKVEANFRLQKIASLPNLGVFSDEAHHTYGNTFDELKRVRETINYIHDEQPIVTVVNTTGTPYYKRQLLKEVIFWYGLGEGIKDNILKDLNNGIHQYDIGKQSEEEVFRDIIKIFFESYSDVALPDGAKAKIAFYFKTQEHLDTSRNFIEKALVEIGEDVSQILVNTRQSSSSDIENFKKLNDPNNQKRVILLIYKAVEGWNCPSLFACALIKEQTKSSNYILQAATRCLRQVPGNTHSAKTFLDTSNAIILDRQLQENFRTDLGQLNLGNNEKKSVALHIRKTQLPKLEITRVVKTAVRKGEPSDSLCLEKPKTEKPSPTLRGTFTPDFYGSSGMLTQTGSFQELPLGEYFLDCYSVAWQIASRYHLPIMPILKDLQRIYSNEIPQNHLHGLFEQVEEQTADYDTIEEQATVVMALIRIQDENGQDVFEKDKNGMYVHHLHLLKRTYEQMKQNDLFAEDERKDTYDLSFHYTPYNFDSTPESFFFWRILSILDADPSDVEAFLFTGGLTDPKQTDFSFEYFDENKRRHHYFPDFVLVKKTGEFYVVEIKAEGAQGDKIVEMKVKAVERIQKMQPDKFKYKVVYTPTTTISSQEIKPVIDWINSQRRQEDE